MPLYRKLILLELNILYRLMNPSVEEDLGRQLHDWAVGEMQFQPAGQYTNTGVPSPEEFQK